MKNRLIGTESAGMCPGDCGGSRVEGIANSEERRDVWKEVGRDSGPGIPFGISVVEKSQYVPHFSPGRLVTFPTGNPFSDFTVETTVPPPARARQRRFMFSVSDWGAPCPKPSVGDRFGVNGSAMRIIIQPLTPFRLLDCPLRIRRFWLRCLVDLPWIRPHVLLDHRRNEHVLQPRHDRRIDLLLIGSQRRFRFLRVSILDSFVHFRHGSAAVEPTPISVTMYAAASA